MSATDVASLTSSLAAGAADASKRNKSPRSPRSVLAGGGSSVANVSLASAAEQEQAPKKAPNRHRIEFPGVGSGEN